MYVYPPTYLLWSSLEAIFLVTRRRQRVGEMKWEKKTEKTKIRKRKRRRDKRQRKNDIVRISYCMNKRLFWLCKEPVDDVIAHLQRSIFSPIMQWQYWFEMFGCVTSTRRLSQIYCRRRRWRCRLPCFVACISWKTSTKCVNTSTHSLHDSTV